MTAGNTHSRHCKLTRETGTWNCLCTQMDQGSSPQVGMAALKTSGLGFFVGIQSGKQTILIMWDREN